MDPWFLGSLEDNVANRATWDMPYSNRSITIWVLRQMKQLLKQLLKRVPMMDGLIRDSDAQADQGVSKMQMSSQANTAADDPDAISVSYVLDEDFVRRLNLNSTRDSTRVVD